MDNEVTPEKLSDSVRAVDRALDVLMAFTAADYEMSPAELLKRVDLSRPTLYRLLYTLERKGFLVSSGDPQRFRLGPSVAHLAHVWTASLNLGDIATPILRRIWERSGETVALFVPDGQYRVCILEMPSNQPLSYKRGVGYRERVVLGASGRAILSCRHISPAELQDYAAGTGVDLTHYPDELELIRKRGYAVSKEELIKGATAVATPFFDASGRVAGAIGVFGPSARLNASRIEDLGKLLLAESEAMSKALGRNPQLGVKS